MGKKKNKNKAAASNPEASALAEQTAGLDLNGAGGSEDAAEESSSSQQQPESSTAENEGGEETVKETREEMLTRHKKEIREHESKARQMMKGAKKNKTLRAENEAKVLQLEYDLKNRHLMEEDAMEDDSDDDADDDDERRRLEAEVAAKAKAEAQAKEEKAKLQRKLDKKKKKNADKLKKGLEKEKEDEMEALAAGPTARDIEMGHLNVQLQPLQLKVKEIASDGHCLFRAVIDQHKGTGEEDSITVTSLRKSVEQHMRLNQDSFEPFLDLESGEDFGSYCTKIGNTAAWGGQLEIRAICHCLKSTICVYTANAPTIQMGEEYLDKGSAPLQLSYHKHYFALGEHYNSVVSAAEAAVEQK